jgi:RimJ/RimL family protein N-acetyltransferase
MTVPTHLRIGPLAARRMTRDDAEFIRTLTRLPEMHAHRPDPHPPSREQQDEDLARDLEHWSRQHIGRYVVSHGGTPVGLCGLTRRAGYPGWNLSYHLHPDHWGKGWAGRMAQAMIELAGTHTTEAYLHGLVRPANPASARVLERAGFTEAGTVSLNGAESRLWIYALGAAPQIVHFTGPWQPVVTRQNGVLHYEAPIDSGIASYILKIEITAEDLEALRRSPDRAAIAHAVLHSHAQAGHQGAGDAAQAILRQALHMP